MRTKSIKQTILARTARMLSGARRTAAVLFAVVLTMTAQTAWAQDPEQVDVGSFDGNDQLTWEITEDEGNYTLTISGSGEMPDNEQPWSNYNDGIKTVVICNGVTSIVDHAFSGCPNLTSVTIPASVTTIGEYAFNECRDLTSVTFDDDSQLDLIDDDAFKNCSSLPSITIPASVTKIGEYAFNECSNLTSVTFGGNSQLVSIDDNAFKDCSSLPSITIPAGVSIIYGNPFEGCTSLTTISVADGNTYFKSVDGVLLSYDGTELITYPCGKNVTNYTIPEGVTTIGNSAFRDCTNLESVTIPTGQIGNSAFEECSNLTTVYIGSGVTSIGWDAFFCTSVTDVYCYADPDKLTWDDSSCDDFQSGKATQCHVIKSKLGVFNAKWNTDNNETDMNVTFVGDIATYKVDLIASTGNPKSKYSETLPDQKTLRQCYKEAMGGAEPIISVSNVVLTSGNNVTVGTVDGWDTPITINGTGTSVVTVTASVGEIPFTITVTESVGLSETIGLTDAVATEMAGKVGVFSRTFKAGVASTICLPFPMTDIKGGKVYEFRDVTYDSTNGWVATMSDATPDANSVTSTTANTPYLFMPSSNGEVTFSGTAANDASSYTAGTSESNVSDGTWTFHGTYSRLAYGTEPFCGAVFGFAATPDDNGVQAGEFVKADEGAGVPPFRCYLTYSGSNSALQARATTRSDANQLPDRITVRLIGKNGETEGIGTLLMDNGQWIIDNYYDLNGRRLDGKPTKKGLYINNGKKVVIK